MNRRKINCVLICRDRFKDEFMHCADLFERFKILIEPPLHLEIVLREDANLKDSFPKWVHAMDGDEKFELVAIFVPETDAYCWVKPDVIAFSTGLQWGLLQDLIFNLGGPKLELRKP